MSTRKNMRAWRHVVEALRRWTRASAKREASLPRRRCEPVGVDADGNNVYSREDRLAILEYGLARRLAAEQRLAGTYKREAG
ncbi:hypothetical protein LGM69_25330 [Burkholderia multivorans]|nr:hypothetical protein [Burkholderia multivorans]